MKKILQVKKGEYLLDVMNNSIKTTYNQDVALDISKWSTQQLGYIVSNLKKVGYTKAKVITIDEELVKEHVLKFGESTSKSMEIIGEALQSVSKRLEEK